MPDDLQGENQPESILKKYGFNPPSAEGEVSPGALPTPAGTVKPDEGTGGILQKYGFKSPAPPQTTPPQPAPAPPEAPAPEAAAAPPAQPKPFFGAPARPAPAAVPEQPKPVPTEPEVVPAGPKPVPAEEKAVPTVTQPPAGERGLLGEAGASIARGVGGVMAMPRGFLGAFDIKTGATEALAKSGKELSAEYPNRLQSAVNLKHPIW